MIFKWSLACRHKRLLLRARAREAYFLAHSKNACTSCHITGFETVREFPLRIVVALKEGKGRSCSSIELCCSLENVSIFSLRTLPIHLSLSKNKGKTGSDQSNGRDYLEPLLWVWLLRTGWLRNVKSPVGENEWSIRPLTDVTSVLLSKAEFVHVKCLGNYESNHPNFRTFICEILHYNYWNNLLYNLNGILNWQLETYEYIMFACRRNPLWELASLKRKFQN